MKPIVAWAVFLSDDEIDCWDERVPIYWRKSTAMGAKRDKSFSGSRVVKVKITKVRKRKDSHE